MQVLEGGGEAFEIAVPKECPYACLQTSAFPQRPVIAATFVLNQIGRNLVLLMVLTNQPLYLRTWHFVHVLDQVAHSVAIDRVAEPQLGFDLISLGDCYLTHVIAEAGKPGSLGICPRTCCSAPGAQVLLHVFVLPVSNHYLAVKAHPAADKAELPVSVR